MALRARWLLTATVLLLAGLTSTIARSDEVSDFYQGKTVTIVVGSEAGGGYDMNARALARVIGRYIPGAPTVIVQNKPGAGSLNAASYVAEVAPRDGTVIAAVQRPVPFQFLFGNANLNFDLHKLQWLGSITKEPGVFVSWHSTPIRSFSDLKDQEVVVGGNGPYNDTELFARAINFLFGTKLKIVGGYPGQNAIILAMERGEVQAVANWSWSDIESRRRDWLKDKKIDVLLQLSLDKIPSLGEVPSMIDLARNDEEREIVRLLLEMKALGRPYFVAPGVPPARLAALRTAFNAAMKDKDFLEEASKSLGPIDPVSGEEMQKMLGEIYALPPEVIEKARKAVSVASP